MNTLLFAIALLQAVGGGGTIQGTVANAANEPIFTARVELTGGARGPVVTRTDGRGQFVFSNVPAGPYRLNVKKEGFIRQEYGQKTGSGPGSLIIVEAGRTVPAMTFLLHPAATMAGSLRNEDGIPVANILVQALRRSFDLRGNRRLTLFSNTLTDDLGAYRLYWVDPGDYYIGASYLPQLPTPVNANEDAPRISYGTTYFPGYADSKEAKPVHLNSGNVMTGLDMKLQRAPALKVSGTIRSILTQAPAAATVMLTAYEESGSTARYSIQTDEKGVFEMKSVVPGSYVVTARSSSGEPLIGFSTTKVPIVPVDQANLVTVRADVVIGPGMTINPRLFGQPPAGVDLRSTQVSLVPLETYLPEPKPSTTHANGTLTLVNVHPGDYLLRVSSLPDTAYVRRAQSDQREVLEQFVRVQYDSPTALDIELAFDAAQITGAVQDAAGQPFDEATVVLVPDTARRHRPDQYRVVTSGVDGKFSIGSIPPGEYKLFAWASIEANAWVNSDVIASYEELGAAATVGPNEKAAAQLRVIR
jgi:hypothetical protein